MITTKITRQHADAKSADSGANMTNREQGKKYFGYFIYNGVVMAKIYGDAVKNSVESKEKPVKEWEITAQEADMYIIDLKARYPYDEAPQYIAPETDSA